MPQTEQQTMREISAMDENLTGEQKRAAWCYLMGMLTGMDKSGEVSEEVRQAVKFAIKFGKKCRA